jgi:hypothetical protein
MTTHIMIGTSMTTKYFAEYVESGTNYRLQTDKYDTYEEALRLPVQVCMQLTQSQSTCIG